MADHVHKYRPGNTITRRASANVTGGQLLIASGDGTVAASTAASAAWVGGAAFDASNGDNVTVLKGGVQRFTAAGAVAAGDQVVPAAAGKVATSATPGSGQAVGVALSTAVDGALVDVDMNR